MNSERGIDHEGLTFTQWRAQASKSFGRLEIQTDDPATFKAHVKQASLGLISLFDMRTSAHRVTKPITNKAPHGQAFCKLSLQIEGHSRISQDGRECVLKPGDLALYVMDRSYELNYPEDQHTLVVQFPQSFIGLSPKQMEQITANPISRDHGLGKVAVPLFEQLAFNLEEIQGAHAVSLVRSSLALLVTVFASELEGEMRKNPKDLLFEQATAYIDKNLADLNLSPSKIADELFVSVRLLHTCFSEQGVSISTYIKERRLDRVRADLANPIYHDDPIYVIAARYGLHDPAHFSRIFKEAYGETPKKYRTRILN